MILDLCVQILDPGAYFLNYLATGVASELE